MFSVISGFSVSIGVYSLRWVGSSNVSLYDVFKLGGIDVKDILWDISFKDMSLNDERM